MTKRTRVGVVGTGLWARDVHAPMLAQQPQLDLVGVWGRDPAAAASLAEAHDAHGFDDLDALFGAVDAVAFAVPPDVQAELATRAAQAGLHLLLEKPVALDLAAARALADAVTAAGVATQVLFTWQYAAAGRQFRSRCAELEPLGGRATFLTSNALGGPFATPWRLREGALLDLGPHVLQMLASVLGPVVAVAGRSSRDRWASLVVEHATGVVSDVTLSSHRDVDPIVATASVHASDTAVHLDMAPEMTWDTWRRVADEFARTATGVPHHLDVHHGLAVQAAVEAARVALSSDRWVAVEGVGATA